MNVPAASETSRMAFRMASEAAHEKRNQDSLVPSCHGGENHKPQTN